MEVREFESVKRMQLRCSTLLVLASLLWLTGCGTVNHMQFRVTAGPPRSPASGSRATVALSDRTVVEEILKEAAQRLHLEERTAASLVPTTIVYYLSPDTSTPIKLLAWSYQDRIVIDFMHAPGTLGEDTNYRDERDRLWEILQSRFGSRVEIVPTRDHVIPRAAPR